MFGFKNVSKIELTYLGGEIINRNHAVILVIADVKLTLIYISYCFVVKIESFIVWILNLAKNSTSAYIDSQKIFEIYF